MGVFFLSLLSPSTISQLRCILNNANCTASTYHVSHAINGSAIIVVFVGWCILDDLMLFVQNFCQNSAHCKLNAKQKFKQGEDEPGARVIYFYRNVVSDEFEQRIVLSIVNVKCFSHLNMSHFVLKRIWWFLKMIFNFYFWRDDQINDRQIEKYFSFSFFSANRNPE